MDQITSQPPLSALRHDERFDGILLVKSADVKTTSAQKNYLDMTLADRTGSINAKFWDGTKTPPPMGSVIQVRARGNEYNGRLQLRLEQFSVVRDTNQIDMNLLIPCAPEPPASMLSEIQRAADQIQDQDLRLLTCRLLDKAGEALLTHPAAKQMHHAERSGLLHHTLSMLRAAKALLPVYPQLNPSLLIAGVIVHDRAKIDEMQADKNGFVSDYTLDGKLIGHIIRGVVHIEEAGREVGANPNKVLLLEHMILAHHGLAEYGSPKPPMFPEAEVLHAIDTLDAKLNEMDDALTRAVPGGFSEKIWGLDNRQIYRIPEEDLTR